MSPEGIAERILCFGAGMWLMSTINTMFSKNVAPAAIMLWVLGTISLVIGITFRVVARVRGGEDGD